MDTVTRLYLIRHGEVDERYHRIFGGRIDMELSAFGRNQAEALGKYLAKTPFDALYASPMKRAQHTLEPIARSRGMTATVLNGLREVDFGAWTGLRWDEVQTKFQISAFDWLKEIENATLPEAETGAQFRGRVQPCLEQVLAEQPGKTSAIVCHGGVIRMILSGLLGLSFSKTSIFEIDYASVTIVDVCGPDSEIQLLNFAPWRDLP
jgi:broad specificity phosphatase PhoE